MAPEPPDDKLQWIEDDRKHVWHPYTQMLTAPAPIPLVKAQGVYLYTAGGDRILDGISSWWVNIHGHSHPRLNRALQDQVSRFSQVMFAGFTHQPAARLARKLVERAPSGLTRVFFSDDGSTAVEVALKMAYQGWKNRGQDRRNLFVALENAYHGDTFGAMAVGGVQVFHAAYQDLFFEVRRVRMPGTAPGQEPGALSSLDQILETQGDRVAAVIVEPLVLAAGGMVLWPVELLRHIREETRERGIPLIADEVFTGFGRTGKMFACQHGPIQPDIMCLSKALTGGYLPLSATLASEEIYQAFLSEDRSKTFFHGHSYSGNALACAVALESLAVFDDEKSLERVQQLEGLFAERMEHLQRLPVVEETRGLGPLAVIQMSPAKERGYLDDRGSRVARAFLEEGILLRPLGNILYFLPPYVITDDEVQWVFDTMEKVLRRE